MRTIGEILNRARVEKRLTLDEVENKIKIRKKYLAALEENAWNRLPSLAYIKGFLKNYSSFLNLKSEEMLAIFRRQYQFDEKEEVIPEGMSAPLDEPVIRLSPQTVFLSLGIFFILLFFINLFLQYKSIVSPPNLIIERPNEGEILHTQSLEVKGKTDSDAAIEINKKHISLNEKGEFDETFTLQPGINTIVIESTSKHGKKKTITRTVRVEEEMSEF